MQFHLLEIVSALVVDEKLHLSSERLQALLLFLIQVINQSQVVILTMQEEVIEPLVFLQQLIQRLDQHLVSELLDDLSANIPSKEHVFPCQFLLVVLVSDDEIIDQTILLHDLLTLVHVELLRLI